MPPTTIRPASSPDSARSGVAIAALGDLLTDAEQSVFQTHLELVKAAPGAALLVWRPDAICLAYNRAYRSLASLRMSALGKPLFVTQPELERAWRPKLEQVFTGSGVSLDGLPGAAGDGSARAIGAEVHAGWLLPVTDSDGDVLGALAMFVDVGPVLEPHRRVLQTVAQELREAVIGVRFIVERLARAPRITLERCMADVGRILEHTGDVDRSASDLSAFARITGGGLQLSPRPGDLGALVQGICEELAGPIVDRPTPLPPRPEPGFSPRSTIAPPSSAPAPSSKPLPSPVRVNVVEVPGAWDAEAMKSIVVNMIAAVRKQGADGSDVAVSVSGARDGGVITVRGDGKALREDELDTFDPSRRSAAQLPLDRRRAALGLYIARELVQAHGGRLSIERTGMSGFVVRAVFPAGTPPSAPSPFGRGGSRGLG